MLEEVAKVGIYSLVELNVRVPTNTVVDGAADFSGPAFSKLLVCARGGQLRLSSSQPLKGSRRPGATWASRHDDVCTGDGLRSTVFGRYPVR